MVEDPHVSPSLPDTGAAKARLSLGTPPFLLKTAPKDSPQSSQGPPTANHQLPPTANRQPPPTANHCSILFL